MKSEIIEILEGSGYELNSYKHIKNKAFKKLTNLYSIATKLAKKEQLYKDEIDNLYTGFKKDYEEIEKMYLNK